MKALYIILFHELHDRPVRVYWRGVLDCLAFRFWSHMLEAFVDRLMAGLRLLGWPRHQVLLRAVTDTINQPPPSKNATAFVVRPLSVTWMLTVLSTTTKWYPRIARSKFDISRQWGHLPLSRQAPD